MKLKRWTNGDDGTLGKLNAPTARQLYCLEEEDQGNRRNVSRIPAGTYLCKRTWYNKGNYATFEVTRVPHRSRILFHRGNTEEDTAGCILLGYSVGVLEVTDEDSSEPKFKLAVLNSRNAFNAFMDSQDDIDTFWLDVEDED